MGYSCKIKIDSKRPRKDGRCAIFMQVIIDRKKARFDLDMAWPLEKFKEKDYCRPMSREENDINEASDNNILINDALAKANEINRDYRMRHVHLTLEAFVKEYKSNLNKNDFIQYMAQKSFYRWNKGLIGQETYEKEKGTIEKLKSFQDPMPFYEFNYEWAFLFDKHLKRVFKNEQNTRWMRHKHVITYLNMARELDKINFNDPYERFQNRLAESSWGPLDKDQLKKLTTFYFSWRDNPMPPVKRENGMKNQKDDRQGLTAREVVITRKFLFSCNSSLRMSDLQNLNEDLFTDGKMSLTPEKTERYGTKLKAIPLNDDAKQLLEDEINFVRQQHSEEPYLKKQRASDTVRIFETYVDQSCNKYLKDIARKAGFDFNLHMHMGRYTFGSLNDEAGANHTALMKQMGIKKRTTLDKYVKTNDKVISDNVDKMNTFVKHLPHP